jgi:N-acetylglucosaminyl-diphospho-decaprenol L-rhamnosyltransferase
MISVIIPVLNQINWTIDCIQSLKEGEVKPDEIILIDNGSTDPYKNITEIFRDMNVLYIRNDINIGVNHAWNLALSITKRKYALLLNNDTVANKYFLKKVLKVMEDKNISICIPTREVTIKRVHDENKDDDPILIDAPDIEGWAFTIRTEVYNKIGPIPNSLKIFMGDTYLYSCANILGYRNVKMINNTVYHYGSLTLKETKSQDEYRDIHKKENYTWNLMKESVFAKLKNK